MKQLIPSLPRFSGALLLPTLALFFNTFTAQAQADTTAPTAICQNLTIHLDEYGEASIVAMDLDKGSSDNFGIVDYTISQSNFDCNNVGKNTVILTVTDAAGNQASCNSIVTVKNQDLNLLVSEGFEILVKSNVVFENDFEAPAHSNFRNCAPDFAQNLVSELYGNIFDQQWTVETMQINGPQGQYSDPAGTGGNYCLGMLAGVQDDKIAFTFSRSDLDYVNLEMDVSAIDVPRCGGPFGIDVPEFNISLYDTPSGQFSWGNIGPKLDEGDVEGCTPNGDPYTFTWQRVSVELDASQATSEFVTVIIDQKVRSGYAALDNIIISSSTDSNKFVNQLIVNEGDTAWLQGTFEPGSANTATISADFGTPSINNETGYWYWYYPSTDGPNESKDVKITIANNCASQDFNFELIVNNVAPSITGGTTAVTQNGCTQVATVGAFTDPGADTIQFYTNYGTVTNDFGNQGAWNWESDLTLTSGDYVVEIYASDEDGAYSDTISFNYTVNAAAATAVCKDITLALDESGNASIDWTDLYGGNEACGIVSASISKTDFNCADAGVTVVTLEVTNQFGETSVCAANVTIEEEPLSVDITTSEYASGHNISCNGLDNGSISLAVTGGCAPYTYQWANGATGSSLEQITAGSYQVTILDAAGQSISQTIKLSEPAALSVSISGDAMVYLGYSPKSCTDLISSVSGGVAPYSYSWSTGSSDEDVYVCPEDPTTYTLTVVDANNCVASNTFSVCVNDVRSRKNGRIQEGKVDMCHKNGNTLSISVNAVEAHLAHGDYLGVCGETNPCESVSLCDGCESDGSSIATKGPGTRGSDEERDFGGREATKAGNGVAANEVVWSSFPNPFSNTLNLELGTSSFEVVSIRNAQSKLVFQSELAGKSSLSINTSELSSGVYFLILEGPSGKEQKKIVLNR